MARETAEQKLLKLIQATDAGAVAAAEHSQKAHEVEQTLESVKSVGISFPPFMEGIGALFQIPRSFGLREVNRILPVGIALVAFFLVFDFIKGTEASKKEVRFTIQKNAGGVAGDILPAFKGLAEYVGVIKNRNIFHPYEKKVEEQNQISAGQQRITEKIADFKLVGVSWLDSLDSVTVMIEDEKTSITHFLKAGEELKGVKVEAIYADSVILSYENEKITIDL